MEATFQKIRKYNYWDGQTFSAGFRREDYLQKIQKYIGNKLVKVIVGQRRTGKSYVLRQIMDFLVKNQGVNPSNIFYLNKEFTAFDEINAAEKLEDLFEYYKSNLQVTGKIYLFLDEIQNIKEWERFVNSYSQDFTAEYEIFVTGSNSTLLSGELSTLLSGRYVEFEIFPFSLIEFAGYFNREVNKDLFLDYLKMGGLPEMLTFTDEEIRTHYVDDLKNTIILRDIVRRKQVKDIKLFEDIFKFITLNIGNLTSLLAIVKFFKSKQISTNYETLSTYVGHLLETFVVHEVQRYDVRGKQALGGVNKYYLNDLAYKNYIFGFYPTDLGYHLENFVFLHLKRAGYRISVGVLNQQEIDFIAEKVDKKVYLQVAWQVNSPETIHREFGNLLAIRDNYEKIVISMDDVKFSDYQGINHFRPWEFIQVL
jgi:predicted AAA+ superfamily ATPase